MALRYLTGFGGEHQSEAVVGALPVGRNNPQRPAHGLYAEQLSGTSFTAPRHRNRRTWLYRIRPSVQHGGRFTEVDPGGWRSGPPAQGDPALPSEPLRWDPFPYPDGPVNWRASITTVAANGDPSLHVGAATHVYAATADMVDEHLSVADGELLVIPQEGALRIATECGVLEVAPGHVALLPRAMTFRVELPDGRARGWICENHGLGFELPDPGPIGVNAMAAPRDFEAPVAAYEDDDRPGRLLVRSGGRTLAADVERSPLDVVAWHGNHVPYRYDLRRYSPLGALLFDHPDPSIWTVLTSPSDRAGWANVDFVVFRDRWAVQEDTFRPPWFHRNVMSELMGLVEGAYDAKVEGFGPGGTSLHNAFTAHGPDADATAAATQADLAPVRMDDVLAFMLESRYAWRPTRHALESPARQTRYTDVWAGIPKRFEPPG